jgi:antitoxin component of RelBE/YafQ-DinJ toxin-antitoxin module
MFERYTEKARRVIFFARYEASAFGSPYIETEHLLLGLVREARKVLQQLGLPADTTVETLRLRIDKQQKLPAPSVNIPLSNESKGVLAYAAEEAERLQQRHVGTEHLLLGLLREETTLAAGLLGELGVTLADAGKRLANLPALEPWREPSAGLHHPVLLHGIHRDVAELQPILSELRRFHWEKQAWKPVEQDMLLHRPTGRISFYHGQPYDAKEFEVRPGATTRDHCELCRWALFETADPEHGLGYTNGRSWLCTECGEKFLMAPEAGDAYPDFT